MNTLEDVLNSIGDFLTNITDEAVSFSGVLNKEENDIVLKCKFACRWYKLIDPYTSSLQIYGDVNGIEVTLIAAARNLFAFFANHYLTFGTITFIGIEEKESGNLSPYTVYLNHEELMPTLKQPFLITSSQFEEGFQTIWTVSANDKM